MLCVFMLSNAISAFQSKKYLQCKSLELMWITHTTEFVLCTNAKVLNLRDVPWWQVLPEASTVHSHMVLSSYSFCSPQAQAEVSCSARSPIVRTLVPVLNFTRLQADLQPFFLVLRPGWSDCLLVTRQSLHESYFEQNTNFSDCLTFPNTFHKKMQNWHKLHCITSCSTKPSYVLTADWMRHASPLKNLSLFLPWVLQYYYNSC